MRAFALAALLLGALLAGCSGPSKGPASDSGPTFDDLGLQATSSTGVIRGVVVDDAIRPVPGAKVTLMGDAPKEAVSTDQGTFGFDGLPAATYFLKVHKPGYVDAQQSADVVAGLAEPPVVKVQLLVDATSRPYVESFVYEGYVECTSSVLVVCGAPNLLLGDNVTNDRFTWDQYLTDGASLIQSEMVWDSTQALSPQLYFEMEALDGGCDTSKDGFLGSSEGESPIVARIEEQAIQEYELGSKCPIYYSIFAGDDAVEIGRAHV